MTKPTDTTRLLLEHVKSQLADTIRTIDEALHGDMAHDPAFVIGTLRDCPTDLEGQADNLRAVLRVLSKR